MLLSISEFIEASLNGSIEASVMTALTEQGHIEAAQVQQIKDSAAEVSLNSIAAVSRMGIVGDDTLYEVISSIIGWNLVDKVSLCPLASDVIQTLDKLNLNADWCINHHIFPVLSKENTLKLYVGYLKQPSDLNIVLVSASEYDIQLNLLTPAMAVTVEDDISRERAVSELFGKSNTDIAALAEEAPVINLVNSIVERAIFAEASDIHIEAGEKNMVVRFRIDGKLTEFMQQPSSRFPAIASRIKLLSQLDIAERRLPQDGRFSTRAGKKEFDVRVSTAPDVRGESIVMRLLPKQRDELKLASLGFEDDHLALIKEWGSLSNGIILVTGPTGSGKSTTLYGLLADIKTGEEKILTVEDPVEYQLDGIVQVQARSDIGYTFAKALRTFLRQDPDIIMVGEIRDKETADISIQSSLTGHLVLSTLHTNDACSVFPRLADIGVEPYLTAATIQGVQAQRLVRKLCQECAVETTAPSYIELDERVLAKIDTDNVKWKKAVGCKSCHGKGYRGRVGIYELVPVTNEIRQAVADNAEVTKVRKLARNAGFRSLLEDGLLKAAKGVTTVEEVLRVCSLDEDIS